MASNAVNRLFNNNIIKEPDARLRADNVLCGSICNFNNQNQIKIQNGDIKMSLTTKILRVCLVISVIALINLMILLVTGPG